VLERQQAETAAGPWVPEYGSLVPRGVNPNPNRDAVSGSATVQIGMWYVLCYIRKSHMLMRASFMVHNVVCVGTATRAEVGTWI